MGRYGADLTFQRPFFTVRHPTSAEILVEIGGVEFLMNLCGDSCDMPWGPLVGRVLDQLVMLPGAMPPASGYGSFDIIDSSLRQLRHHF